MLGEHFSQKLTLAHPYNPFFEQKRPPQARKMGQQFFPIFVKRLIKPLGKI